MKKAAATVKRIQGKAAGVDADGNYPTAIARERALYEEQLRLVRKQKQYYIDEEKRLMELLDGYPLPGQLSYLEEEE